MMTAARRRDKRVGYIRVSSLEQNTDRQLEATYIFPVPKGASVNKFTMWVDGKEVAGELLDAPKANQIYTDIVRRTLDPGLLEYVTVWSHEATMGTNGSARISVANAAGLAEPTARFARSGRISADAAFAFGSPRRIRPLQRAASYDLSASSLSSRSRACSSRFATVFRSRPTIAAISEAVRPAS